MNYRVTAMQQLELALREWYYATDQDVPDIGILIVGLSGEGCDLQYVGRTPQVDIDWPTLFARIIQELERGTYTINGDQGVPFK